MNNSNYVDYEDIKTSSEHKSEYIRELQQQNKRYEEAFKELSEAPEDMPKGKFAILADRIVRETLEDIQALQNK